MCRVIMVSKADFRAYDKQYGILKLMDHLEKECGGHGNGYALIKEGKIIETRKGQALTNEEIYNRIVGLKWDYLVYHTRINSMGGRGDANCHPFVQDNDCLAMNGTEHSLRTMSDAFGRTDTECIFKNMAGLGLEQTTRALVEFGSVFVGCAGGRPFVVKAGGTLHKWNKGGKTFHASTFPAGVKDVQKISDGYIWEDGKENLQFLKKHEDYSYGYGRYGYGSYGSYGKTGSLWGSYYDDDDDYRPVRTTKKSTGKVVSISAVKPESVTQSSAQSTSAAKIEDKNSATSTPKPAAKTKSKSKGSDQGAQLLRLYELGKQDGRKEGYQIGYEEGYAAGQGEYITAEDYDSGFSDGYYMGYNDALAGVPMDIDVSSVVEKKKSDPTSDYNIGFADGRDAGYDEGFDDGYSKATSEHGINMLEQED